MRTLKQYAVEIISRHQHGRYGKDFYFGMYVPGFSKKDAEENAMGSLAEMTFAEIEGRCVNSDQKPWQISSGYDPEMPVGFEKAEFYFTCRAYIE